MFHKVAVPVLCCCFMHIDFDEAFDRIINHRTRCESDGMDMMEVETLITHSSWDEKPGRSMAIKYRIDHLSRYH